MKDITLRLDPDKVAHFLGRHKSQLYRQMKTGLINIGDINIGNTKCHYIILKPKLEQYIGRELTPEESEELTYKSKRKQNGGL